MSNVRAAEDLAAQYPGQIVHMIYPDTFGGEPEITISTMFSLAADPDVTDIVYTEFVFFKYRSMDAGFIFSAIFSVM
jgi:hypothetical protein